MKYAAAIVMLLSSICSAQPQELAGRFGAAFHGEAAYTAGQRALRRRGLNAALGFGGMGYYNFTEEWSGGVAYTDIDLSEGFRAEPLEAIAIRRFPLAGQSWAPYGRLGVGINRSVDSKRFNHPAVSAALGAETYFLKDFSVGLEGLWRYIAADGSKFRNAHLLGGGLNVTWFFPCSRKEAPAVAQAVEPAPAPPTPKDSDGDGVLDSADKCGGTPDGTRVDAKGCPKAPEKVSIELKVLFDTAKHDVKPEFDSEIQRVADFMRTHADTTAEIEGHTDNQGDADYNRALSQRRAGAVRQALIDKFGISAERLTAKGYGPDQPIADNNTEEGRARNRRVVATLTATKQ